MTTQHARRRAVVQRSRIATVVVVGILLIIGLLTEVKAFLYAMIVASVVVNVGARSWLLQRENTAAPTRDEGKP